MEFKACHFCMQSKVGLFNTAAASQAHLWCGSICELLGKPDVVFQQELCCRGYALLHDSSTDRSMPQQHPSDVIALK